jgi:hypothetical protein
MQRWKLDKQETMLKRTCTLILRRGIILAGHLKFRWWNLKMLKSINGMSMTSQRCGPTQTTLW